MPAWLNPDSFDDAGAAGENIDGVAPRHLTGSIQVSVSGGKGGELRYHLDVEEGRLVSAASGPASDPPPAVAFTVSASDAEAMRSGGLDPTVAYMQGRLKTAGDPGWVLDVLAHWSTPEGKDALSRLSSASR